MALQQLSSGGASRPVAPVDATSQAAQQQQQQQQQQSQNSGFNLQQYSTDIASIPTPVVPSGGARGTPQDFAPAPTTTSITALTGTSPQNANTPTPPSGPASPDIQIDPFSYPDIPNADDIFIGAGTAEGQKAISEGVKDFASGTNPYPWDPFSFAGSGEGSALPNEAASPGYQQFGQTWLDLLNTVGSQNLQWGGTNQFTGELKGGGSVGPWLSQNIVAPWNSGNQQQAYAGAIDFISSQTGKPPQDPETQKLAGAFLEYTLQNNSRYGANTQNFANRKANDGGKGILGIVEEVGEAVASIIQPELAPAFAALNLAQGAAEGTLTPLSALSDIAGAFGGGFEDIANIDTGLSDFFGLTDSVGSGVINAADASLLSDFGTAGQVINGVGDVASGIGALSNGSILGAIGPAINFGGIANSFMPGEASGTTGSNATASGGITSSLANSLGIDPKDFSSGLDDLMAVGSVAGAAIPLGQRLTADSPTLNIQPQPSAAPSPPETAAAAPGTPSAPGESMTAQQVFNPSQAGYRTPGPRQANPGINPQLAAQILQALGVPT